MVRSRFAMVMTVAWSALAAAQARLGAPAPQIALEDPPAGTLEKFRGHKVIVLGAESGPQGLAEAAQQLRQGGVELVRAKLPADGNVFWLVDEAGIVRAIRPAPVRGFGLVEFFEEWELGRKAFAWGCTTCHGQDGRETYYYGVKSLGGIGNRMTPEQIRRTLNATMIAPGRYSIRCFHFTEAEIQALVTYVAGL